MTRRVLAFDTSADVTTVAISADGSTIAELHEPASERHAELLLPRVQVCLKQVGLSLREIELIGVGLGPGSFTGVRVGVATAKGLGLGLGLPVCGVVSLEALALGATAHGEWLAPLLDAFKGEVFGALYRVRDGELERVLAPCHGAPSAVLARIEQAAAGQPLTLFGNGLRRYEAELASGAGRALPAEFDAPRARYVAQLAALAHARGDVPDLARLTPLYLRDSDAQLPKTPLRL